MLAHRRVAWTANRGRESAQIDATDEIDEDLDEREDTSDTMDSGDENVELDVAREERRADIGNGSGSVGFQQLTLSRVDLAKELL